MQDREKNSDPHVEGSDEKKQLNVAEEGQRETPQFQNPPSNCIQVANLRMPFTIIDLRELMETFGKFERCWTNRTQTHCLVEFKSEESAKKAAESLYLKEWPVGGLKLVSDYIELKRMNDLISRKSVPDDLNARVASINGDPLPEKPKSTSHIGLKIKTLSEKLAERGEKIAEEHAQTGPTAQQKSKEENQSELDKLFSKTTTKPQVYFRLLTREEAVLRKRPPRPMTSGQKKD